MSILRAFLRFLQLTLAGFTGLAALVLIFAFECACVDDEPAIREDKGDFVWRGAAT